MNMLKPIRIGEKSFELDLRGWMCPLPKYVFDFILPKLSFYENLDLLVDCPGAITDIPENASQAKCKTEVTQIGNGEWRITINK